MAYRLRDRYNHYHEIGTKLQIGRDPSNQILLDEPQGFPFHATLWEQGGILYLQDGSAGKATFLNQVPVQGTVALRAGDQITLGTTPFFVESAALPPQAPQLHSQPIPAAPILQSAYSTPKKRKGCGGWILTALLVFASECVLIAVVGLILAGTDVEMRGGFNDLKAFLSSDSSDTAPTDASQPGPEVLALNETWLTNNFTESFSQLETRSATGLSPSGTPVNSVFTFELMEQTVPNWSSYVLSNQTMNGSVLLNSEYSYINGTLYSNVDNSCSITTDNTDDLSYTDQTPYNVLTSELTGHVKRVEEGIMIDGILADRYQLRLDNIAVSDTVTEFISGDLYRAREGGYLVQLDYVVEVEPQSWTIIMSDDFSETEPVQITYHFERSYVPEGTLTVKTPEVCADQVP